MNLGLPGQAMDVLADVARLMARLPELERSISQAARRAQETLDRSDRALSEISERLGPLAADVGDIKVGTEGLDAKVERLEAELAHVLDRVPGLSPEKAKEDADVAP